MKRRDQLKKLKGMTTEDLRNHVQELSRELMNLRFRQSSRQLTNSAQMRNSRREIARAKTFIRQAAAPTETAKTTEGR